MKIFLYILGFICVIFTGVYTLAFTQFGNDLLKPYITQTISEKLQKNVVFDKFSLRLNHISLHAKIPNEANLIVDGDISLFRLGFDIIYQIDVQNLKTPSIHIKDKMLLSGSVMGVLDNFKIKANGQAFDSDINIDLNMIDKFPSTGNINAKGIDIAQILAFLGKPTYSTGKIDIQAYAKNNNNAISGKADILVNKANIMQKEIAKDFGVLLPFDVPYRANIHADINDNKILAKSDIISSLIKISTTKTTLNLENFDLFSDFLVKIDDLKKLESLSKIALHGKVAIEGDFTKKGEKLFANIHSDMFNGVIKGKLEDKKAQFFASNLDIKKTLYFLGQNTYAYGKVNMHANIDDIYSKDKNLQAKLEVLNGELVGSLLRNQFGINLPPVSKFNFNANADLKGDELNANAKLNSALGNVKLENIKSNLNTHDSSLDLDVNIPNLAPVGKIASFALQGEMKLKGMLGLKNKMPEFDLNSDSFGGEFKIKMQNEDIQAKLKNISLDKILNILVMPKFAKGEINADANIKNALNDNISGSVKLDLHEGFLLGSGLKQLLKSQNAFPEKSNISLKSDIKIQNSLATFTNSISSNLASLSKFDGTFDIKNKKLNSQYIAKIDELNNLQFLTNIALHGKFDAKGEINYQNNDLFASFHAPILGGISKGVFQKGILDVNANDISIKALSELLAYPYVFDSNGEFKLHYDTKNQKGDYSLFMANGRMVENELTNIVAAFSKYNLAKEVYKNTNLTGVIDKNLLTYALSTSSEQSSINIPNGKLNLANNQTQANFQIQLQKTDLAGEIKGDISKPIIKITKSNYLENKAKQKIGKELDKHMKEEDKKLIKDILNLF